MREALGSTSSITDKNENHKIACICLHVVGSLVIYWKEVIVGERVYGDPSWDIFRALGQISKLCCEFF